MVRKLITASTLCCLLLGHASVTRAQDETRTYRWDLSSLDGPGLGGFAHALLIGPGGGTIVSTRFIVEFVSLDAWDAAGVEISLAGPILQEDGSVGEEVTVTGADFGWSGTGHFEVVYETDELNGDIVGTGFPTTLWSMHLNDISNPYIGHFITIRIELDVVDLVADESCPGDLNGDGEIQADDMQLFKLGLCPADGPCPADIDGDGAVTQTDRELLISFYGIVCPVAP